MLTRYHRRNPQPAPAPGSRAATAAELPKLDGARVAVLGLHHGERGTILHLHAGGVTMEDDWEYYRGVRPLPALWIRDSASRWHATCTYALSPLATAARSRWSWRSPRRSRQAPADRRGGRRAIGRDPGQAAAALEVESVTATGADCFTWVQLLATLGHAGRPVIHKPTHALQPAEAARKAAHAPGEPDEDPALSGIEP